MCTFLTKIDAPSLQCLCLVILGLSTDCLRPNQTLFYEDHQSSLILFLAVRLGRLENLVSCIVCYQTLYQAEGRAEIFMGPLCFADNIN